MEVQQPMAITLKNRQAMFEKALEDLGFQGTERSWPFMEDGHRQIAHIHAKDLYEIIQTMDWDDIQELEDTPHEQDTTE